MKLGRQKARLAQLREWPENPRRIDEEALDALRKSLRENPDLLEARPLIALPDGTVIAGNMRLRALRQIDAEMDEGVMRVPVFVVEADEQRAREIALRDNNQFGEWEADDLAAMVEGLAAQGTDLASVGFSPLDVQRLLGDSSPHIPDPPPDPYAEQYGVILVCKDEAAQRAAYDQLRADFPDADVRVVTT